MPSTTSTRTTSASSLSAMRTAQFAPTLPAPTTVTFFRKASSLGLTGRQRGARPVRVKKRNLIISRGESRRRASGAKDNGNKLNSEFGEGAYENDASNSVAGFCGFIRRPADDDFRGRQTGCSARDLRVLFHSADAIRRVVSDAAARGRKRGRNSEGTGGGSVRRF